MANKKKRDVTEIDAIEEMLSIMDDTADEDEDIVDEYDETDEAVDESDELYDEDETDEDEYSDDDDDDEDEEDDPNAFTTKVKESLAAASAKVKDFSDAVSERAFETYTNPDESTVISPKKSIIAIAACSVAFVALAVLMYFFCTSFNYYTTGITVDEFIDRFNNLEELTSDSDIYLLIPSYTDVKIPEDAKLSGKNTIELMDGHIVIDATTRFGKIIDMTVTNVDFPGYNPETYVFDLAEDDYYLYFYVCLGKVVAVFDPEINTVYDATYSAYQMHQYSYIYMYYGEDDHCTVDLNNIRMGYHLVDSYLKIEPVKKTITSAVWPDWLTRDDTILENDIEELTDETVSSADVSASDVQ